MEFVIVVVTCAFIVWWDVSSENKIIRKTFTPFFLLGMLWHKYFKYWHRCMIFTLVSFYAFSCQYFIFWVHYQVKCLSLPYPIYFLLKIAHCRRSSRLMGSFLFAYQQGVAFTIILDYFMGNLVESAETMS